MAGHEPFVTSHSPVNKAGQLMGALHLRELVVNRLAFLLDQKPLHIIKVARGENGNILDG